MLQTDRAPAAALADVVRRCLRLLEMPADERHTRPRSRQCLRDRLPQPAAAFRDQRHATIQPEHLHTHGRPSSLESVRRGERRDLPVEMASRVMRNA